MKRKRLPISVGMLSWHRPEILRQTLESYRKNGFLSLISDFTIFFNEITVEDRQLALDYRVRAIGSPGNEGILGPYRALVSEALEDHFLFLENDWRLLESPQKVRRHLEAALELITGETVQCVRLRHRKHPGAPLHSRLSYEGRELEGPEHLIDTVHWLENPAERFPDRIRKVQVGQEEYFIASSKNAHYTNNPCLYRTQFIEQVLSREYSSSNHASAQAYALSKGVTAKAISLEGDIAAWWHEAGLFVAQGRGLFEHRDGLISSFPGRLLRRLGLRRSSPNPPVLQPPVIRPGWIAFSFAHRSTDTWSTPLSVLREFEERGWKTTIHSLYDSQDCYTDAELVELRRSIEETGTAPDIFMHMDYTGFRSPQFAWFKKTIPLTVFESADDPRQFKVNRPKAKDFHLTLTPDFPSFRSYRRRGVAALWWPHFADTRIHQRIAGVAPRPLAVSTRGVGNSLFMDELSKRIPDLFENRNGLHGTAYSEFLCSGTIVLQNSRDHEITRRLFEGAACGRLVLTDRLPAQTRVDQIFGEDREIVYYSNLEECVTKIRHLLSPEGKAKAERIALRGHSTTMANHTQAQRVDRILSYYRDKIAKVEQRGHAQR